jgi:2-polyprenyl-6-methoxyphenol hydroxylase-like FAD-dependent oxidoreductase
MEKENYAHSQVNYMVIRAVVVGGSLGGLSSALALRCVNCDVDVFERSRGAMKSRGAGLVVQTELIDFLNETGLLLNFY